MIACIILSVAAFLAFLGWVGLEFAANLPPVSLSLVELSNVLMDISLVCRVLFPILSVCLLALIVLRRVKGGKIAAFVVIFVLIVSAGIGARSLEENIKITIVTKSTYDLEKLDDHKILIDGEEYKLPSGVYESLADGGMYAFLIQYWSVFDNCAGKSIGQIEHLKAS